MRLPRLLISLKQGKSPIAPSCRLNVFAELYDKVLSKRSAYVAQRSARNNILASLFLRSLAILCVRCVRYLCAATLLTSCNFIWETSQPSVQSSFRKNIPVSSPQFLVSDTDILQSITCDVGTPGEIQGKTRAVTGHAVLEEQQQTSFVNYFEKSGCPDIDVL